MSKYHGRATLKKARIAAGLTQAQVAERLGICPRYYKAMETGERLGSIGLWDQLEDMLKVHQRVLREVHHGTEDGQL